MHKKPVFKTGSYLKPFFVCSYSFHFLRNGGISNPPPVSSVSSIVISLVSMPVSSSVPEASSDSVSSAASCLGASGATGLPLPSSLKPVAITVMIISSCISSLTVAPKIMIASGSAAFAICSAAFLQASRPFFSYP